MSVLTRSKVGLGALTALLSILGLVLVWAYSPASPAPQRRMFTANVAPTMFSSHLIDINDSAKGILTCPCTPVPVTSVSDAYAADTAITDVTDLVAVVGYGNDAAQLGTRQADFATLPAIQELVLVRDTHDSHGLLARLHLVTPTPVASGRLIVLTGRLEYDPLVDFQNKGFIGGIGAFVADLNSVAALSMSNKGDYQAVGATPPQIDTQNGNTTDILLTREVPLVTLIGNMPVVGRDLAVILGPTIRKLVNDRYDRSSNSFTVFEPLSQQVADIKTVFDGLQQGIADDVKLHQGASSPASTSPSAAVVEDKVVSPKAVPQTTVGHKKAPKGTSNAPANAPTHKKGVAHSGRHHKAA